MLEELEKIKAEIVAIEQAMSSFDMLRQRLQKDFNLDELKAILTSFPYDIHDEQKKAQQIRSQIPGIEAEMKGIEAELAYEISMETNGGEKPKPKFPNADARKTVLIKRLQNHAGYLERKKGKEALEFELVNLDFEVDRLRNSFRATLAVKDLIVAEITIYRG